MEQEENNNPGNMATEPSAALYYGTSTELRESGIIPELSHLNQADTMWIIRFLQSKLEQMRIEELKSQKSDIDPMYGLNFLKSIHEGMPDYEELKAEYLQEKYGI
jgi:hypothetical protein